MDQDGKARQRLKAAQWNGLEAMIEQHAEAAIEVARVDYRETLDWALASVERLERVLNRLCPAPEPLPAQDGEWLTLLWGSYFGELLRRHFGGVWEMTLYPGTEFSVPTLSVAGSKLYPMMKVHRRLSLGAGESLPAFLAMVEPRLRAAAQGGNPLS